MNRRNIFGLSAIAALGLALLPGSAVSQQKSLKEQIVGTWTFVSALDVTATPFVIPGARRIAAEELEQRHQDIPRDQDIILYCS